MSVVDREALKDTARGFVVSVLKVMRTAARSVLEGEAIDWCEEHDMPREDGWSVCRMSMWTGAKSTCSMVCVVVVPIGGTDV